MKHYPKTYEDKIKRPPEVALEKLHAKNISLDQLTLRAREFYRVENLRFYDNVLKAAWLKGQLIYDKSPIRIFGPNGFMVDQTVAFYMRGIVGYNGKLFLDNGAAACIISYIDDFYPEFFENDPFLDVGYYKFPYENLSLEHICLVHECDDRLEMLEYADSHAMNIRDFTNWATNWAYCYNEEDHEFMFEYFNGYRNREFPVLRKFIR